MEKLGQDLRFAFRLLAKSPGFAAIAIVTLALGIGANAVIFSAVDAVLLRPLPYPHAERLFDVLSRWPRGGIENGIFIGQYQWLAEHCRSCESVAAFVPGAGANLSGSGGAPLRVRSAQVNAQYFPMLQMPPELGRAFAPADELPNAAGVAILSDALWRARFNADPGIVGRGIRLDGALYTVVGVARPRTDPDVDLWTALHPDDPLVAEEGPNINVSVRLKPNVTLAQAQAEVALLAAAYNRAHPSRYEVGLLLRGMHEDQVSGVRPQLLILLYAVGLVLLIACVNVANLLLSRANGRRREMAVRAALGAGRGRIARQLLTESVLLGLAGGGAGLLLAWGGLPLLLRAAPRGSGEFFADAGWGQIFGASGVHLDATVLLYSLGLALLTGLLFGMAPAWQLARGDLHGSLKEEGGRAGGGARRRRTQSALVAGEFALAFVLLAGAGLLIASILYLEGLNVGFDTHSVFTVETSLSGPRRASAAAGSRYLDEAVARLERIPGVAAAAAIVGMPLVRGMNDGFRVTGSAVAQGRAQILPVTADFFAALGLKVAQGRAFTAADTAGSEPVCIVSPDLARQHWPAGNAVGQQIVFGRAYRIIGVTAPARMMAYYMGQMQNVYIPLAQTPDRGFELATTWFPVTFLIRAHGDPALIEQPALQALASVDDQQPFFAPQTLDAVRGATLASYRFLALLLGLFAALALALGAIGIYGVMAHAVAQRTREIGIRVALGATRGHILRLVVGEGLALAGIGLAVGVGATLLAGRLLASQLYGVQPGNAWLLLAAAAALAAAAWAACQIPARRAMRIDPTEALRYE
ncbi:MAG TPA: ABC transporter permease [Terriglobales bacterium]|nr:ABC transporter permease [Terriglobales bacterium]